MLRKSARYLLFSFLVLGFSVSTGRTDPGDVAMGVKAGTLGLGIEGTVGVLPQLNLRAGANAFSFDFDATTRDVDYELRTDLLSFPIVIDWHPFKTSAFRLTGGILLNYNEADFESSSQSSYTIGDTTYTADELGKITGKVDFNTIAPYAGIGWGNALGKTGRWSFSCDVGVVFQGKAKVDMFASGPVASDPAFQEDLAREKKKLKDELEDYKYYPVVSLGVTYRF